MDPSPQTFDIRDYRRLQVWRRAHDLTMEIYRATSSFPDYERFGLIAQLRASVVSIEANIAEGSGRRTASDYGRFLDIALDLPMKPNAT